MSTWWRRLCDFAFNLGLALGCWRARDTSMQDVKRELEKRLRS
ncbi:hypothetical protein [Mesorhizobium sp. CA13]|nr:hypothetical protein [Mesorhizobium sp. CA13]